MEKINNLKTWPHDMAQNMYTYLMQCKISVKSLYQSQASCLTVCKLLGETLQKVMDSSSSFTAQR